MRFDEIHSCAKSRGKMVAITKDLLGITRCGYCHQIVDYSEFMPETRVKDGQEKTD